MTDHDRIDYLAGEVSALVAVLGAVIRAHPDPERLVVEVARLTETQTALSLPATVSEHYLQGQRERHSDLAAYVLDAVQKARREKAP